jgi:FkbM family methyltransferase
MHSLRFVAQSISRLKSYAGCAWFLGRNARERWSIFWRETKNIRVRLRLARYQPERIYPLQTVYGPLYFRDNFGDITNLPGLFYENVYRVRQLKSEGAILDVGANIGLASKWLTLHNPSKTVYSFEPLPANTALIALNCPEAVIEPVAVGSTRGRRVFHVDRQSVMASTIPCSWETEDLEFDAISIDDYVADKGIDSIALLKIDVEGMEYEVLEGAQRALRMTRQLVMETHSRELHHMSARLLESSGWQIDCSQFNSRTGFVFASRIA